MIKLVKDTISNEEIDKLCSWLKSYPILTKGVHTDMFEKQWGEYLGTDYNLFRNLRVISKPSCLLCNVVFW